MVNRMAGKHQYTTESNLVQEADHYNYTYSYPMRTVEATNT